MIDIANAQQILASNLILFQYHEIWWWWLGPGGKPVNVEKKQQEFGFRTREATPPVKDL